MRIKITTAITYLQKKVCIKISPIHNIFKWMFVYYKCYISMELIFLKELMLTREVHEKSAMFATIAK